MQTSANKFHVENMILQNKMKKMAVLGVKKTGI